MSKFAAIASVLARNVAPSHEHDCSVCVFLGSAKNPSDGRVRDLYYCPKEGCLLHRYGADGGDYGSLPCDIASQYAGNGSPYSLALVLVKRWTKGEKFERNLYGVRVST